MPARSHQTIVRKGPNVTITIERLSQLLAIPAENLIVEDLADFSPNLVKSYQKRYELFIKGALFCIDRMPQGRHASISQQKKQHLKIYLNSLYQSYNIQVEQLHTTTDDRIFQEVLRNFCAKLVAAFKYQFEYSKKQIISMLSTAEEYVLLLYGRSDLVTLSNFSIENESGLLIQKERKISPLSEALKEEFWLIKTFVEGQAGESVNIPIWFSEMDPLEKNFLEFILEKAKSISDLDLLFSSYSSRLRTIIGPANCRSHSYQWLTLPNNPHEPFIEKCSGSRVTSSMIASRDASDKSEYVQIAHAARNLDIIISAAIRDYAPGLIETKLRQGTLRQNEEITLPILVQTLISPLLPQDKQLIRNKKKGMQEINKVFQGDVSSQVLSKYPKEVTGKLSNGQNFKVLLKPVLYSTNHPQNFSRHIEGSATNDPECLAIISLVEQFILDNPDKEEALSPLLQDYKSLLEKKGFIKTIFETIKAIWLSSNREIFLSSLEQLMFVRMQGIPYGSCVSAKDRKSLEFIHTDSMELFYKHFGYWPSFSDSSKKPESRAQFVDIFAHIYVTRHHHVSAGQNAPGAEGIKTPDRYLPPDMQNRIRILYQQINARKTATLECDNQLASNNELSEILSELYYSINWDEYKEEAKNHLNILALHSNNIKAASEEKIIEEKSNGFTEENYQLIYQKLADILNARNFWYHNTYYQPSKWMTMAGFFGGKEEGAEEFPMPNSALAIKKLFKNETIESFSQSALETLANKVTYKKESYGSYPKTNLFYKIISELYFSSDNKARGAIELEKFLQFHQDVMSYEKNESQSTFGFSNLSLDEDSDSPSSEEIDDGYEEEKQHLLSAQNRENIKV